MTYSRRNFLKTTGVSVIASGFSMGLAFGSIDSNAYNIKDSFKLGIAGYTFAKFNLDQTLVMMQRVGVKYLALNGSLMKNFHLPLDSTQEVIDQTLTKIKTAGVVIYAVGPIYMGTEFQVDQAFDYARRVGTKLLVGVPNCELLPYVNKKVKEYDMRLAIHNHGPGDKRYASAENIWENIKTLDKRMGICLDIGHTTRLGDDAVATFLKYNDRIYEIHLWDTDKPEKEGGCVEIGRGIINFPAFIKALRNVKYTGTCSLEYFKD